MVYLDFEKPLADIEGKAEELRAMAKQDEGGVDVEKEAAALDKKASDLLKDLYKNLTPWRKTSGRAASRTSPLQRLHRGAFHRIHPAGGRPRLWR